MPENPNLVWDELFRGTGRKAPKYTLDYLLSLEKDGIKQVFDMFFSLVYYRYYEENGITFDTYYDAKLLDTLGLSFDAGEEDIKRKFRQLAKRYHPDTGGDSAKFIDLMEVYHLLLGGK